MRIRINSALANPVPARRLKGTKVLVRKSRAESPGHKALSSNVKNMCGTLFVYFTLLHSTSMLRNGSESPN
jgi:hypothetical protein